VRFLKIFVTVCILVVMVPSLSAHAAPSKGSPGVSDQDQTQLRVEEKRNRDNSFNQTNEGIESLVGVWREVSSDNPSELVSSFHYRFQLKGDEILMFQVSDKDDLNSIFLKGEEVEWAVLKLDGRHIVGKMSGKKGMKGWKGNPIRGFVSEGFREIKFEYPLIGATEVDSGRQAYSSHTLRRAKE